MASLPVPELLGRDAELRLIGPLLHGRPLDDGPGLLLRGDPGVGKSALLDAAAARAAAAGVEVLRADGVPFEAGLGYAALHQLLDPLRERAARLVPAHRDALEQVFRLAPGPDPDPPVFAAVLALLRAAAAERPLLLVVDDLPAIDPASAAVLGFAARRASLAAASLTFLGAARTDAPGMLHGLRPPEHVLGPLAPGPAAALLDACWPGLAPSVRCRLLDAAAGLPLALVELPAALTDRQRLGLDPLPSFLPLTARLAAAFGVGPALSASLPAALDPDSSHPAFRHPLVRAAVVQAAGPEQRRAAHLALAGDPAVAPERRAWHLAEAATGPDEATAQAIEEAALAVWRAGRSAGAVDPLVRAAELSPQPADRSRRLIEAAYVASGTGPLDRVTGLLAEARRADDARQAAGAPNRSVFASATAAYLLHGQGEVDAAYRLLAQALADPCTACANGDWVEDVLYSLLNAAVFGARQQLWDLLAEALDRLDPHGTTAVRLCFDALTDPGRASGRVRDGLVQALDALPADPPPWRLVPLVVAATAMDMLAGYQHLCRQLIEREGKCGAIGAAISAYLLLSADAYHRGEWTESEELAQRGLDLAGAQGYQLLEGHLRVHLAFLAAARGDADRARSLSEEVMRWAAPRGLGNTLALARYALALAALGERRYEEAYLHAAHFARPGDFAPAVLGSWTVMDFAEAAERTGRADQARAHVAAAERAGLAGISPRRALVLAGAAALVAPDERAGALFETALALPDADRWPFEQARIQLSYGEWLRRTRDTTTARFHLRAAQETFDRLGARPWSARAADELRAAGVVSVSEGPAELTAQERRIAALAAAGLTNKQIGQQLYLSHRTVSGHLHRIFPKLGITSRAALRDALGAPQRRIA